MKRARVVFHRPLKGDVFLLGVEEAETAPKVQPGQFCMLRAWPGKDPLLARPFSVHDREGDRLTFLIQVRGRGTALLSRLRAGDEIEILGPLGRGFPAPSGVRVYLVAGGLGVAPFYLAAKELLARGIEVELLYGARSREDLVRLSAFRRLGLTVKVATEDGSLGHRGLVTELLEEALARAEGEVFACGPWPMLQAVAEVGRRHGARTFLSLEARMACGLGLCLGCAVKRRAGGYLHVCTEGPVVPAEAVF